VQHLGELGHDLGDFDAGQLGVDGLEDAANVVGDIVLGIPEVEMAGPTLEVDQDDALGFAESGAAGVVLLGGGFLPAEEVGQTEAKNRGAANAEQLTPSDAVASILPC